MKQRKRVLLLSGMAALIVLAAGAGIYTYMRYGSPPGKESTSGSEIESGDKESVSSETPSKTEYTEEEKALVESQTGVTVADDGVIHVDLETIMAEEESVNIKREEAYSLALESLGEGAKIESASIREHEETKYWVVRAIKGDESWQIWLNADNGEEFIKQKDG